jgi:hypothetical protein
MPSCDRPNDNSTSAQAGHPEWLTYTEVMAHFGVKKTHLYGRLSKLVRTRKLPGETKKWSRSDLEQLAQNHTLGAAPEAVGGPRTPDVYVVLVDDGAYFNGTDSPARTWREATKFDTGEAALAVADSLARSGVEACVRPIVRHATGPKKTRQGDVVAASL